MSSNSEGEAFKVALRPRVNINSTIEELKSQQSSLTSIQLNFYKRFFEEAEEEKLEKLFEAVGSLKALKTLIFTSKGSNVQVVPANLLAKCLNKASQNLETLHLDNIRVNAFDANMDCLSDALADLEELKVLKLHCEDMDVLEQPIAAAGQIPTLEICEIESATIAQKIAEPSESLCWSKSLHSLKLINVAQSFGDLFDVISLLAVNQVLQELTLQVSELDVKGGQELVKMLAYNSSLQRVVLQAERMANATVGEAFIPSLAQNESLQYFQIILDGRQSDMKVVRAMGVKFRDTLKGTYKVTPRAGMAMGVICEREAVEVEAPAEEE
ncbi:expressed unknown protein [Seminavis robusta]|uniref:Uncharacterized protein n=1 Tax=Seminavis robusta TaxID=568900 RepID=A0A9N8DWJ5_9STRA|nr:expressed unknown protein [Seminavis robusta]|eukprot:Sro301_g111800.1 n/a (327) ;mRNA; f:1824-2804